MQTSLYFGTHGCGGERLLYVWCLPLRPDLFYFCDDVASEGMAGFEYQLC